MHIAKTIKHFVSDAKLMIFPIQFVRRIRSVFFFLVNINVAIGANVHAYDTFDTGTRPNTKIS